MATKIKKITSKWIVESSGEILEFDNLLDAEKKASNLSKSENETYLIRKDYINNKLIEEILIG